MVFMALDHASFFVSKIHYNEVWGVALTPYHSELWFFTRFISHFCAPGFLLLMGIGMTLFRTSRIKKGWTERAVKIFFIKRGLILMIIPYFLEYAAWGLGYYFADKSVLLQHNEPGGDSYTFLVFTVLFSLGISMVLGAFILKLSKYMLWTITIIGILLSFFIIQYFAAPEIIYNPVTAIFFIPGDHHFVFVKYGIFPWFSLATGGMLLGRFYASGQQEKSKPLLIISLSLLALFVVFRLIPIGNFQKDEWVSIMDFFTIVKYPPSPAFITLTLGINILLLYLLTFAGSLRPSHPILVFGRTPLFFYFIHLYLYALAGLFFPSGTDLILLYIIWAVGLIPLYYLCKKYLKFKSAQSNDSIWRLF